MLETPVMSASCRDNLSSAPHVARMHCRPYNGLMEACPSTATLIACSCGCKRVMPLIAGPYPPANVVAGVCSAPELRPNVLSEGLLPSLCRSCGAISCSWAVASFALVLTGLLAVLPHYSHTWHYSSNHLMWV